MAKPPPSTPHSDIGGVNEHERRSTDVAAEQGDSAEILQDARTGSPARPPYSDDKENRDDRTR